MEVNQPNKGIFKGMGKLESNRFINRKYFPRVRNVHGFDFSHHQPNDYQTSFQLFKEFDKKFYALDRVKKNRN